MRSLNPRARPATSQRTCIVTTMAAVVIPALVLAACSDTSLPVTAPPKAAPEATSYSPGEQPPNVVAGLVFCDVALLAPSGNYRQKHVPIKVSRTIFDPQGKTVKVGFRGWTKGVADPGSVALCRIPATAAATDFFRDIFSVDSVASRKGPRVAAVTGGPAASSVIGDGITIYEGQSLSCEQQILPDETCSPGGGEVPTDEGPPPVPDEPTDIFMGEEPGYVPQFDDGTGGYYVAALSCFGRTDYPHLSGTFGFYSNVNVHASTYCLNGSTLITVTTLLSRQKCVFWVICWWYPVGLPGFGTRFGTSVDAHSNSNGCSRGYYKGNSFHTAVYPSGLGRASTSNSRYIYC